MSSYPVCVQSVASGIINSWPAAVSTFTLTPGVGNVIIGEPNQNSNDNGSGLAWTAATTPTTLIFSLDDANSSHSGLAVGWSVYQGQGNSDYPSFNNAGAGSCHQNNFEFRNCRPGNPIGNISHANGNSNTMSTAAITATHDKSLALLFWNFNTNSVISNPSGWSQTPVGSIWYKQLALAGDSSGAPSVGLNASGGWDMILFELMGVPDIPGDFWANGYPNEDLVANPPVPAPLIIARGTPY